MKKIIKNLIDQDEKVYLEFKQKWYWDSDEKPSVNQWGELLKDLIALANCNEDYIRNTKYMIIGVNENEGNLYRKVINKKIDNFPDIEVLRNDIDDKIDKFFRADNKRCHIDYTISKIQVYGGEVVVIEIKPITKLITLNKNLPVKNRTETKNHVFYRFQKENGGPEVIQAPPESMIEMESLFNKYRAEVKKIISVEKSVEKTISLFSQGNDTLNLNQPIKSKNIQSLDQKSSIIFEIYPLKSDFNNLTIIYIDDKSNQSETFEYIKKNKLIDISSKIIILIDNDSKRDRKITERKFNTGMVFTLKEFAKRYLYSNYLEGNIYHDGNFKKLRQVEYFIEPYAENKGKNGASELLNEWYAKKSRPLVVIKGYGGIGKTTLVKYFLDELYYSDPDENKIIFIDSKKIISEISKEGNINNIFHFYKAYATVNKTEKIISKELLELTIDNGSLLIVLDGIDEVIAKLGNNFNIDIFIKSIYENYLLGNEKTKIIITCRDYFWDDDINSKYNIDTINLSPFTLDLAKKFFNKEFKTESNEFKSCIKYSDEFKLTINSDKGDYKVYIPYILDVIMDMVLQKKEFKNINKEDISQKYLNTEIVNDYFIGRICEREVTKLYNLETNQQLTFFMNMALYLGGIANNSNIQKLFKDINVTSSEKIFNAFKSHTLVSYDKSTGNLQFKYDFFKDYFLNLCISKYFKECKEYNLPDDIVEIIIEYIKYDNSFTDYVCKRLTYGTTLKVFIIDAIKLLTQKLKTVDNSKETEIRHTISSMVIILLVTLKMSKVKYDINSRTDILIDIFGENLQYLSIINFISEPNNKPTFDFKGLQVDNAIFENYPYFWECKIDKNTSFHDSIFKDLQPRNGINISGVIHQNLFVGGDTSGIQHIIDTDNHNKEKNSSILINEVKKIFRLFENGGLFKEQKIGKIRARSNTNILDRLISKRIITPYKNPDKPTIKQYKIDDGYFDVMNALEQNGSNVALQRIIKRIS